MNREWLHLIETPEKTHERLQFSFLKEWISNTHHREICDVEPLGCPFRSLAVALGRSESYVRALLVATYLRMDEAKLRRLIELKLQEESSFFYLQVFEGVEDAMEHWRWYLRCLCCESRFAEGDDEALAQRQLAKMPLDYVDLELLCQRLQRRAFVLRLDGMRRFGSEGQELLLVHHRRYWAPLLGARRPVEGFKNRLVTLQNLNGTRAETFNNKSGCLCPVQGHEEGLYYVAVGHLRLPMLRHQMQIVETQLSEPEEFEVKERRWEWQGPALGRAPSLRGIPDGALEFQLLAEYLGDMVHERLQQKRMELLGRVETELEAVWEKRRPLPAKFLGAEAVAPVPRPLRPVPTRWDMEKRLWEEVMRFVREGREIWVTSPSFKKTDRMPIIFESSHKELFMAPQIGMNYRLRALKEGHALGKLLWVSAEGSPDVVKYTLGDALCQWEVLEPVVLQGHQGGQVEAGSYLRLSSKVDEEETRWNRLWEVELWSKEKRPLRGTVDLNSPRLRPVLVVRKGDLPAHG